MTTDHPTAFFAVNSPTDPLAHLGHQARKADYLTWRTALPTEAEYSSRDFTEYAATITRSTGVHADFIALNLYALSTLDQLPRLRVQVERHFHVDMHRLRGIDRQLTGIHPELLNDPEFWDCIDDRLTDLLTATTAHQLMPSPRTIAQAIKVVIKALTPAPEPEEEAEEEADADQDTEVEECSPSVEEHPFTSRLHTTPQPDGSVLLEVRLDQVTATKIEEAVRTHAASQAISFYLAFIEIFLMNISVAINLNLYKAKDLPDSPGFLQPYGPLDREDTEALAAAAKQIRDADAAGAKRANSYQPTKEIRAAVEGRDGVCRWPGCNRPASRCQLDHRINYEDGGPTGADNLLSLCQTHHNRKTDGQVHYLLDPITGDVVWLFADGTYVIDYAEGPLAPRSKHWNQSLAQKAERRRERAWAREKEAIIRKETARADVSEEEPPF
ncbi:HNH endonuclease signature motif containing protein [Corynebacterium sp. A21]|uniref:HNH endonuclease signature motif containing protein n=1 Tax=Corynebacterium sp. A21 TaxID=3457318 RepID=UPI003FD3E142